MLSFNEIFADSTKYCKKIKTDEYHETGKNMIVDQGQSEIAGYTDLEEGLFSDVPAIIFGDHTRIIKYVDRPFFIGADGVKVLKSKLEKANYRYLYYALKNVKIPNTGYNRHFKWLKETIFNYPNSDRQQEIVLILNKLQSIITHLRTQLEKLDLLVKSRFVEMFGNIENMCTIADVCSIITDGTHQPPKFTTDGIPFLFVSNIATNEIVYNAEKFISEETYNDLYKRTPIEIGDIILSTVGSYGHPAIVKTNKKFLFQRHIAYLKPIPTTINSIYLHRAILSDNVQRQIDERVKGIAQKTLNLSEIRKIVIPAPPLELQTQFANFVKQVDQSKSILQQELTQTQTLFNSLMQEYFG